jgi:8-oxo-dGTP pyrophosphatase MutT (NUDIX family)
VVQDSKVALIRRERRGCLNYVLPGGGIEDGESPESAVVREVREELGLCITVEAMVALVAIDGDRQHIFTARIEGGEFGSGHGDEVTSAPTTEMGSYVPVWIPIDQLIELPVFPSCVVNLVSAGMNGGRARHAHEFASRNHPIHAERSP